MITYDIIIATMRGGMKTIRKTFSNENHFDNWYKFMNRQGIKIVDTFKIN